MANHHAHCTVTKVKDGKEETKARYHAICNMADAKEALSSGAFEAFRRWQDANKVAEGARKGFEAFMASNDLADATVNVEGFDVDGVPLDLPLVPEGYLPVFGYNFGRIAVAAIPAEDKRGAKKAAKTALKLKPKAAPAETTAAPVPTVPATETPTPATAPQEPHKPNRRK